MVPDELVKKIKFEEYSLVGHSKNNSSYAANQKTIMSIDRSTNSISTWINPLGDDRVYHVQYSYEMLKKLEAVRDQE